MFTPLEPGAKRGSVLYASLALHVVLLVWLVVPPAPVFVRPSSVAAGKPNGTAVTYLFWPSQTDFPARNQTRLTWADSRSKKHAKKAPISKIQEEEEQAAGGKQDPGMARGSQFGSLAYGDTEGTEVRPAIRVSGSEPFVSQSDLMGVREGNIVIEVTIDEQGNIVRKVLLQSLNSAVDNKVMAALEDWRFLPATQDGVAIPSKQDVYYHFPVRR